MGPVRQPFGPTRGGWQACPPGELQDLAGRLRLRRWVQTLAAAGTVLLVSAGLAFSAWQVASAVEESRQYSPVADPDGIYCPCSGNTSCGGATAP